MYSTTPFLFKNDYAEVPLTVLQRGMEITIMKKQLLTAALAFVSVGSFAQTFHEMPDLPYSDYNYFPATYSKDGKPYLLVTETEYDNGIGNITKEKISVYDENLSFVKSFSVDGYPTYVYFSDLNNDTYTEGQFTQIMFNDDDSFEYFINETPDDGHTTVYKLMSENGKQLARFSFPKSNNTSISVIKFGEKDYMFLSGRYVDNQENFLKIYSIEKSSNEQNAIHEVTEKSVLSVLPSLARRNENVSIQLGDHASGRLQVVSSNGSVVRQIPIQEGHTSMQLNTRGLPSGMYVVSVVGANGTQENCKIVIR